jgi:hypothetical protein
MNMNTKHTAGPWIALPWDEMAGYDCITPGVRIEADKPDGRRIVTVDAADYGWNRTGLGNGAKLNREESQARVIADARLISAAPKLLEACKRILYAHDSKGNGAAMGEAVLCSFYATMLREVIKEAEEVQS